MTCKIVFFPGAKERFCSRTLWLLASYMPEARTTSSGYASHAVYRQWSEAAEGLPWKPGTGYATGLV